MEYNRFQEVMEEAWDAFFNVLYENDIDGDKVDVTLSRKDCFNDVFDAVLSCVELESEDE